MATKKKKPDKLLAFIEYVKARKYIFGTIILVIGLLAFGGVFAYQKYQEANNKIGTLGSQNKKNIEDNAKIITPPSNTVIQTTTKTPVTTPSIIKPTINTITIPSYTYTAPTCDSSKLASYQSEYNSKKKDLDDEKQNQIASLFTSDWENNFDSSYQMNAARSQMLLDANTSYYNQLNALEKWFSDMNISINCY